MKKSSEWLLFLSFYTTMCVAEYLLFSVYHVRYGDPIHIGVGVCITVIFCMGFMLYLWRSDIAGFLKRVLIAVPFALIFAIFIILVNRSLVCAVFGLLIYLLLLFKTPSWKQHFSVTLALASILVIVLKFLYAVLDPLIPQYVWLLGGISIVFLGFFYCLYVRKVIDGETIDLRVIFFRILKFTVAFGLYLATCFIFEEVIAKHYSIGLKVSLAVTGILTIVFLAVVYFFDLLPIERKRKKSKLGELQSQLNDVYRKKLEK